MRRHYIREKGQRLQQAIKANEAAFIAAVDEIAAISGNLLSSLEEPHTRSCQPNWKNVVATGLRCPFGDLSFVK